MPSQWITSMNDQFGVTMFDEEFDPYQTLKNHDEWLLKIAEHMEQLAKAGAEMAHAVERQEGMIRHLALTVNHQQKLILQLNERLLKVETQ